VRKQLEDSISQRSEEPRLYNLVYDLTISNPGLKAVSSTASPGSTIRFLEGGDQSFLKEGVKIYQMAPMSPFNLPTLFLASHL
jgi:hypothetical protein